MTSFWNLHQDAEPALRAWYSILKKKRYANSHELKADFPTADFLGDGKTVFNIGGNKYPLVVWMRYKSGRVYITHIVTHGEYDKLTKANKL